MGLGYGRKYGTGEYGGSVELGSMALAIMELSMCLRSISIIVGSVGMEIMGTGNSIVICKLLRIISAGYMGDTGLGAWRVTDSRRGIIGDFSRQLF
jgi:hypothetical protein